MFSNITDSFSVVSLYPSCLRCRRCCHGLCRMRRNGAADVVILPLRDSNSAAVNAVAMFLVASRTLGLGTMFIETCFSGVCSSKDKVVLGSKLLYPRRGSRAIAMRGLIGLSAVGVGEAGLHHLKIMLANWLRGRSARRSRVRTRVCMR